MQIINCNASYASQILEIINEAILHTTAIYDYHPRSMDAMQVWFDNKIKNNYPVLGIVDEKKELMGFASYGSFRAWPAYKYTVEHSIYVHKDHRGKGLGSILLNEIIHAASNQSYHVLIAGIDANNLASIQMHKKAGFYSCGVIKQVGYKFNAWLDLEFYQLLLDTPTHPQEG